MWRLVLVAITGCSFAFVQAPATHPDSCTESYAAPVADTVVTTADGAILALVAAGGFRGDDEPPLPLVAGFVFALVSAAPYVVSAVHGYATVTSCRRAIADEAVVRAEAERAERTRRAREAAERAEQARATARTQARAIMIDAANQARIDDCAAVVSADAKVAALDAEFHDTVFVRDAAIARCLGR